MDDNDESQMDIDRSSGRNGEKMFTLKKWNAVAMWSWDVECDTCAICRVQVMGMYFAFTYTRCFMIKERAISGRWSFGRQTNCATNPDSGCSFRLICKLVNRNW